MSRRPRPAQARATTTSSARPSAAADGTPSAAGFRPDTDGRPVRSARLIVNILIASAVALPLLWAWQRPPLPAFYSQVLACALWALALTVAALLGRNRARRTGFQTSATKIERPLPSAGSAMVALWWLLLLVITLHGASGIAPWFAVAPAALNLLLAVSMGAWVLLAEHDDVLSAWTALLSALLIAAWVNALVVALQLFAPNWTDDVWIARPEVISSMSSAAPTPRPGGNLRQPNQLATLMVWGLIAGASLLRRWWLVGLLASAPLLLALIATGSRAGLLSLFAVAVVGVLLAAGAKGEASEVQRRRIGVRLQSAAVLLAVVAAALWQVAARDTAGESLAQRVALWRETIALIGMHPWGGVGWSQLNFAWTLTPFATRPADVFDHAHSLPLHLAVELGLPVVVALLALVLVALARVPRALRKVSRRERDGLMTALLLLLAMLLHSLVEYPLWFSYFFLPAAFAFAVVVRLSQPPVDAAPEHALRGGSWRGVVATVCGVAFVASLWAVNEYAKATSIHVPGLDSATRARAVATAQGSPLYGQFGDYAAIMLAGDAAAVNLFARPVRHLLDERLITAWARALLREGETAKAAYVVARAREFAPDAAFAALPQIKAPTTAASSPLRLRDFR